MPSPSRSTPVTNISATPSPSISTAIVTRCTSSAIRGFSTSSTESHHSLNVPKLTLFVLTHQGLHMAPSASAQFDTATLGIPKPCIVLDNCITDTHYTASMVHQAMHLCCSQLGRQALTVSNQGQKHSKHHGLGRLEHSDCVARCCVAPLGNLRQNIISAS